jgi:hypothetical protein|tara:strand:+ start:24652 stop:24786 length:135 start_codon:yes stop_codon:yes gene_type:complete
MKAYIDIENKRIGGMCKVKDFKAQIEGLKTLVSTGENNPDATLQ